MTSRRRSYNPWRKAAGMYDAGGRTLLATVEGRQRRPRLEVVNPRYRRLVIPGALVGLILIVVVAALLRG